MSHHSNPCIQSPECHQLFIKQGAAHNLTSGSHSQRIQTDFLPFSMMASHLCLAGTDHFSSQQPMHTVTRMSSVVHKARSCTQSRNGSHSQRIQTDFLPFSMMASHLCLAGTDHFSSQQPIHAVAGSSRNAQIVAVRGLSNSRRRCPSMHVHRMPLVVCRSLPLYQVRIKCAMSRELISKLVGQCRHAVLMATYDKAREPKH